MALNHIWKAVTQVIEMPVVCVMVCYYRHVIS